MKDYRSLQVRQRGHRMTLHACAIAKRFPEEATLGHTSQLRRANASIPANIAEDGGRDSDAELKRFNGIATVPPVSPKTLSFSPRSRTVLPRRSTPWSPQSPPNPGRCPALSHER